MSAVLNIYCFLSSSKNSIEKIRKKKNGKSMRHVASADGFAFLRGVHAWEPFYSSDRRPACIVLAASTNTRYTPGPSRGCISRTSCDAKEAAA